MLITTYVGARGATGNARRAARDPKVVLVIETGRRQARVQVQRRANETQREFATRLAGAARLVRAQRRPA